MAWVKLDDQLHAHPKAKRAWKQRGALGLHVMALSYCGAYLTDGDVPAEFVEEKLPQPAERERTVQALVDAGLWEPADDGWLIHDYLEFNDSRADIEARRRKDSERKRGGSRKDSQRNPDGLPPDSTPPAGGRGRAAADALRPGVGVGGEKQPLTDNNEIDARALDAVDDHRLKTTVALLRQCRRFFFDAELIGVANVLAMYPPPNDHEAAARWAVSRGMDPSYRTTDAARALEFAFADMAKRDRQVTGGGSPRRGRQSASDLLRALDGEGEAA